MGQATVASTSVATPARRRRLIAPLATIGGLAAATAALYARDPHGSGTWGICPSAAMGVSCPGCGGLRAVNDLANGDVGAAASSNLLFVVVLPVVLVALGLWLVDRWRGTRRTVPRAWRRPLVVTAVVVLLAFTVLRNLPGSWLAP
ncbi:DUF2752 domain-containing protein [Nocardioides hungaricus]|jgi:hypothetical protein